jgi:MFS family permease
MSFITRIINADSLRWARQMLLPSANQEGRNVRLVFLDTLWVGIMGAGAGTFLSVFMTRLGASALELSLLTSIPAALGMLTTLPASAFVERQTDQVRTVTLFRACYRTVYVILAIAPFFVQRELIIAILILSGIQAALKEVQGLAYFSVVSAVVPSRDRPAINGLRWATVSVLSAIAVALFGRLLDIPLFVFPRNYQVLFGLTAIIAFLALISFSRIHVSAKDAAPAVRATWAQHMRVFLRPIVRSPEFMRYLGSTALLRLGMALPAGLFSIFWINHLGARDSIIGLRETVAQAALVIGYLIFGRLATRRGNRTVLLMSAAGLAAYPVATALCPNQYWLLPVAALSGLFSSGLSISFFEALAEAAPPEKRPSFSALNNLVGGSASVLGPLLGAGLAGWLGIRAAFLAAGALHLIGALLCWRLGVARPVGR